MSPRTSYVKRTAIAADHGSVADTESAVTLIVEEPLEIRVNGEPFAVVMRTPGHEMELAVGFCLTEGIVDSFADIVSIGFCPDAEANMENVLNVVVTPGANVQSATAGEAWSPVAGAAPRNLESRSSCGICGVRMLEDLDRQLAPLPAGAEFPLAALVDLQYRMSELQELSRLTTCAHAVTLAKANGELIVVREDVGRHNALDKVVGYALLHDVDCRDCLVLLSGRIGFEMVQKAVRARIPFVAGVSAATSLAVDLAERLNCTLVGRLRDQRLVIYAHPERLTAQPAPAGR